MSLHLVGTCKCDQCGKTVELLNEEQASFWSDYMFTPPEGWGFIYPTYFEDKLLCPECLAKVEENSHA